MGQFVLQIGLGVLLLGLLRMSLALGAGGLPSNIQGYEKWTPVAKNLDMGGPHAGKDKVVYANPVAAKAWKVKGALPVGSLIVKTAGPTANPTLVAIMNKTTEGWVYEEYTPKDGKYSLLAKGSLCSNCHAGVKDKDYLFTR